jgi:MraZ protein
VFLGTHQPRLDDKGRLILPAKFRDQLLDGVVITKGPERCLYIWPRAEFESQTAGRGASPLTAKPTRDPSRLLFASASDEVPDKQGRVTVPPNLRAYAGLERDVVVIGANNHVELWDTGAWDAYLASQDDVFPDEVDEVEEVAPAT